MTSSPPAPPTPGPAGASARPPQGLLLDAMGTLIDLRQSVGRSYAALAAEFGMRVEAEAIDRCFGAVYRQAPPLAFPGLSGAALRQAEIHWWEERIRQVLHLAQAAGSSADAEPVPAPPPLPTGLAEALFEHFADPGQWQPFAEVPACLARWRQRGLKLAVVSNFDSRLPGLLEGLGLAGFLEAVVASSAAGAAKPDPAPFHQALEVLGLETEAVWHVGDSPEDAAGARAAGIRCLLVQRP